MDEKKTLLVVDDTPANIALLSGLLRGQYRVKAATSGAKALAIAAGAAPPDLVILDVVMPEMDGFEVCRALRGDPATAAIPVIFLTGNTDEAERREALALGAVAYLSKPVDAEDLQARIAACLSGEAL